MLSTLDRTYSRLTLILILIAMVASITVAPARSHERSPMPRSPIDLPCASNAFAQVLGATPIGDGSKTLILARVILEQGGYIGAHTHPGTLIVSVEEGAFGFALVDDQEDMEINRGATATSDASTEWVGSDLTVLNPGDWFVETGMIHTGENVGDGVTTVLLTAVIESGQPLTMCADETTSGHHG
jgi:quercetin dioxygenase-like cupin family protein